MMNECQVCFTQIEHFNCYYDKEYYYHKSCYHFARCSSCRKKETLHYVPLKGRFYCDICFFCLQQSSRYKRMKMMEDRMKKDKKKKEKERKNETNE